MRSTIRSPIGRPRGGSTDDAVERVQLAPGLTVSRVSTGLWQIADMERDGDPLDPDLTSAALGPYLDAGFTTFAMADHYGSAEVIAGRFQGSHARGGEAQLLTTWVPAPGPITFEDVRAAVQRSSGPLGNRPHRPLAVRCVELFGPGPGSTASSGFKT